MDNNKEGFISNDTEEFIVTKRSTTPDRAKKIGIAAGGIALALLSGIYIAGVVKYKSRFFKHTNINGFDASEKTVAEVDSEIADMIANYELRIIERDDKVELIKGSDIDYQYVSKGEVQTFLTEQNAFLWPFYSGKENVKTFDSSASYNEELLNEHIKSLDCFNKKLIKKPKDAVLKYKNGTYRIQPETSGNWLIEDAAKRYISESVDYARKEISFDQEGLYRKASVFRNDKILKKTCDSLNEYLKADLEFTFGKEEIEITPDLLKTWLSYDSEGNVSLDENAIFQFVSGLAQSHDTYGKEREFHTHNDTTVRVTGYEYGWEMDCEATTATFIEDIKNARKGEVTITYLHTARSHENADVGDTYVEVDMGEQHIWMFMNGELIIDSDCVSGMAYDDEKRTPDGIYTIEYKESPSILRGENAEYESPVEYWMPFNGGIGLHDAIWRYGEFGGDIYLYDGSHGCINLPLEVAGVIYDYIYEGYPVVCYY